MGIAYYEHSKVFATADNQERVAILEGFLLHIYSPVPEITVLQQAIEWLPDFEAHHSMEEIAEGQGILENMFNRYGFPGFDVAGKEGSFNFWLMAQHCDKWPAFQDKVLTSMKKQVDKGNANPQNYAYLTDRVRMNTGRKQLYGTQVTYNTDSCQAYPRPTEDSLQLNERRKMMGMESIEKYLNAVSEGHFEMNRAGYEKRGITKAKLYAIKQ
ncbi:DUF6624 domain-containing protein [Paraflavitalea speifideaquila]|uniref:DUF6624 domain-containing protein n=1 Tax=Paraflavitalea speifideaquila TaxID=3076558 RepID=UPI0028EA06EB|nr:DUF6624 domain-containing protein [Paraflavitalea speifideiaquila]